MKRVLSLLWQGWKKFAHVLGIVNTRILLTLTYFLIVAIVSIITRVFRVNLLDRGKATKTNHWHEREPLDDSLDACRHQF